jgi:adenosylhomocysteine nucleosidase
MVVQSLAGELLTMRIGIITAMPEETRSVVRAVGETKKTRTGGLCRWSGVVAGHEILIIEAGMGFSNATTAARQLVQEQQPDLIVSAGFCGGISEALQVGDVVLASDLTIVSGTVLEDVRVEIAAACRTLLEQQAGKGRRLFGGLFVSTATIMRKTQLATLLPTGAPCPVVEMESAAIARVAREHGIPFAGLRSVSDPFDEELSFSLDEFCDDRMRIRIPRVLMTIARKPRIIPQLVRLARNSRIAAGSLSCTMREFLALL